VAAMKKNKFWFEPKKIGWGISYPISWEGWILLLILILVCLYLVMLNNLSTTNGLIWFLGEVVIVLCIFMYFVKNKVRGGLKWRSFKDKNNNDGGMQ
jgi:hypothetical protein